MNNEIRIIAQDFYGNRVETIINKDEIDRFILGYLNNDTPLSEHEKIDRTIVKIPNLDNIVLVYNKHSEERRLRKEHLHPDERHHELVPLATIGDMNIYSKCIVCRVDENGELVSLQDGDYNKFKDYLAE